LDLLQRQFFARLRKFSWNVLLQFVAPRMRLEANWTVTTWIDTNSSNAAYIFPAHSEHGLRRNVNTVSGFSGNRFHHPGIGIHVHWNPFSALISHRFAKLPVFLPEAPCQPRGSQGVTSEKSSACARRVYHCGRS